MAGTTEQTVAFSQVFLTELEYIQSRREGLADLDPEAVRRLAARTREQLDAAETRADGGDAVCEPPTTVLMAMEATGSESAAAVGAAEAMDRGALRARMEDSSSKGLVGLALSGGGIRSATFNLGLLQGLARRGVLRFCDYLSTVSGGGYIGSCLTSLLDNPDASVDYPEFPFRFDRKQQPDEREEVKWLRRHGNYLALDTSLFGLDVWRMIGVQVSGIALTNIVPLALVILFGYLVHTAHMVFKGPSSILWLQQAMWQGAAGALVVLVAVRGLASLRNLRLVWRERMRKALAIVSLLSATLALCGLVVYLGRNLPWLVDRLRAWLPALSGATAVGLITGLLSSENKLVRGILRGTFRFGWVVLLPVLFAWVLKYLWETTLFEHELPFLAVFGSAWEMPVMILLLVLGCFVNTNRITGHHFYRDRLSAAYIIKRTADGIVRNEHLTLPKLHAHANGAPYHVINTTLNVQGSKNPVLRGRGAEIFEFARCFSGSSVTGYCPSDAYENGDTRLATVMAVSGAAAAPMMGTMTHRFLAFLMTLLNVRLNRWMPNPERRMARWFKGWPYYFLKELLGSCKETDRLLNLSDGGHYENLGLYGLVKRGCRFIITSDAAADPGFAFGDLAGVQRKLRIDLGVDIEIDVADLRPDPRTGLSKRHHAVGTIHYPNGVKGTLVYIKTSLTGIEPEDLRAYRRQNPTFPDQSTGDQFFDEGQFESYRKLGEMIARGTF